MDERCHLTLCRFDDLRMAVPGAGHTDACGEVEIAAAILVEEVDTLSASRQHTGCLLQQGRELGPLPSLVDCQQSDS